MQGYDAPKQRQTDQNQQKEPQPTKDSSTLRMKQTGQASLASEEISHLKRTTAANTTIDHQQTTSWQQIQQQTRGSEEKAQEPLQRVASPRSTPSQTPINQSERQNQMPAGLVSGGSIFPHAQGKGRRKIGQGFLSSQYQTQQQTQSQAQTSVNFMSYQKRDSGIFSQQQQQQPQSNQTSTQRVFSKPQLRNLTGSKEEFKKFHLLPSQTPNNALTQLQPQLQTSQNQTTAANTSGCDPLADSSQLSSSNATQRYKHSQLSTNYMRENQHQSMMQQLTSKEAASADTTYDQIREINRGKQTSNYPPAIAFEIYLAKPNIVQNNFSQPKHFQRSSKQASNTAVKPTQQQNQQAFGPVKSSGLQVLGMQRPNILQPTGQSSEQPMTAQKQQSSTTQQSEMGDTRRGFQMQTLPVNEEHQHNPLFPNFIGHSQHSELTPSAHKRKVIKVPLPSQPKCPTNNPQQNLEELKDEHKSQLQESVKRQAAKKIIQSQQPQPQLQDLIKTQLIQPQDRLQKRQIKNTKKIGTKDTPSSTQPQHTKALQHFPQPAIASLPNVAADATNTSGVVDPLKEFNEAEQEINQKEIKRGLFGRQHQRLRNHKRQSRTIQMQQDPLEDSPELKVEDATDQGMQTQLNYFQEQQMKVDRILDNSVGSSFDRESIEEAIIQQVYQKHPQTSFSQRESQKIADSILQSGSSGSSFTRQFNQLLEQSSGLKVQYNAIIRHTLSIETSEVYQNFVNKVIESNRNFQKSLQNNQPQRFTESFTFEKIVQHIENQKIQASSNKEGRFQRIVHSDQSGQLLKSQEVGQSNPSILSPHFSLGAAIEQAKQRRKHRQSMLMNQQAKSQKFLGKKIFNMPDLWHRKGNSDNRSVQGLTSNHSQLSKAGLLQLNIQLSSSGKTPTPQHQSSKHLSGLDQNPKPLAEIYAGFKAGNKLNQQRMLERQFAAQVQENNFIDKRQAPKIYGKLWQWVQGKMIGQGVTGEVYEAQNMNTGQIFCVKKLHLVHEYLGVDQSKIKALKKEIDRLKQLDHPNIVTYYGGEMVENNVFCIYLEYMPSGSIYNQLKMFGRYGEKICLTYTRQILNAIVYLHSNDIVHGDLKGANVLISLDGKDIKLCDLGSSRMIEGERSQLSFQTMINGTLAWSAPECTQSKTGKKSDVWSLGCLIVEMLTGDNPWGKRFEEQNFLLALSRALQEKERPECPKFVSERCQKFVERCLTHRYEDRPYSHDLLEDPWIREGPEPSCDQ